MIFGSNQKLLMARAGVKPSGPFDPTSLFGPSDFGGLYDFGDTSTLWQDTSGTTPVTSTGQSVFRIDDLSGNGNHLTATSAPLWDDAGFAAFNGSNNALRATYSSVVFSNVTIIGAVTETTRQGATLYNLTNTSSPRLLAHVPWSDGNYYFDMTPSRISGAWPVATNSPAVFSYRRSGTSLTSRINNSAGASGSISSSDTVTSSGVNLGDQGGSTFYAGHVYSFLFINRALSDAERLNAEVWMAAKNGAF